jgi:hypothetical protein
MAFRILDQRPQYRDASGNVLNGGLLYTYINNTTTAKATYSDVGLSVPNANPIVLGSDGRTSTDVFGSGTYSLALKTSAGVTVWTASDVQAADSGGTTLPALSANKFLTNNGAVLSWATILQVPDPTGNAGKQLGTDGTTTFWEAKATATVYSATNLPGGITASSTSIVIGTVRIQWGSDTCPTIGGLTTTKAVTFGAAFTGTPYAVIVTAKSVSVTSNSPSGSPSMQATSQTSTGFTASAFVGEENTGGTDVINSTISFTYVAIGPA